MSQDPTPVTRAEKRAARDAARAAQFKRGTKRKADDENEGEARAPRAEKNEGETPRAEENELEQDFIALPAVDGTVVEEVKAASDEAGQSTRKARRAARDAERAEKFRHGKKRKLEEDGGNESVEDGGLNEVKGDSEPAVVDDEEAKAVVSKKRKMQTSDVPAKKSKAARKPDPAAAVDGETPAQPAAKQRFIVFLGNLPYTTTDASLLTHFASLQPFTLRHRTDPKTKKSKGFAFLEFEAYDRMKTCLKLYHHSYFDPEAPEKSRLAGDGEPEVQQNAWNKRGKKEKGRKINVELTAGGGGAKEDRKEKIRVKNVRLEEQRQRRAELERKEKGKKDGKTGDAGRRKGARNVPEETGAVGDAAVEGMHPARLAMMNR